MKHVDRRKDDCFLPIIPSKLLLMYHHEYNDKFLDGIHSHVFFISDDVSEICLCLRPQINVYFVGPNREDLFYQRTEIEASIRNIVSKNATPSRNFRFYNCGKLRRHNTLIIIIEYIFIQLHVSAVEVISGIQQMHCLLSAESVHWPIFTQRFLSISFFPRLDQDHTVQCNSSQELMCNSYVTAKHLIGQKHGPARHDVSLSLKQ